MPCLSRRWFRAVLLAPCAVLLLAGSVLSAATAKKPTHAAAKPGKQATKAKAAASKKAATKPKPAARKANAGAAKTKAATGKAATEAPANSATTTPASKAASPASPAAATAPAGPPVATTTNLSPVGHWTEKSDPNNGLQLWWDFNPDGTLSVTAGATARTVWHLAGSVLTVGKAGAEQSVFDIRFAGGKLYSTPRTPNPPTLEYSRLGAQPAAAASPLVGKWQITGAPHATDPKQEEVRNRMVRAITSYAADGTYEVRAPLDQTTGTWDAGRHTYTLKGYGEMPFDRTAAGLTLSSPVGPKGKRFYVPDGFY